MIHGDNDYALSRLRARAGNRMRMPQWRQLSAARSVPAVLEQLRASAAGRWVSGLSSGDSSHRVEARLRTAFIDQIDELAGWADPAWQPALRWCARLVDLPLLRHARINRQRLPLADWPTSDCAVFEAGAGEASVDATWQRELQRRLPSLGAEDRTELALLQRTIAAHRQQFSALPPGNGWGAREELHYRLLRRQRRNPLSPVHLLTAAALLWLDHERVRGELLRLAAMPGAQTS